MHYSVRDPIMVTENIPTLAQGKLIWATLKSPNSSYSCKDLQVSIDMQCLGK